MNKKRDTFFEVLLELKNILNKKPSLEKMKEEVRLMGFYIRPLAGNPAFLTKVKNEKFIELLWTLGKIDNLIEENFHQLTLEQKEIILQLTKEMKKEINLILPVEEFSSFADYTDESGNSYLMVEVFCKNHLKKSIN